MNEKNFSINDEGYFGISFCDVNEYPVFLVTRTVGSMVGRGNEVLFVDAAPTKDVENRRLTIEGVTVDADAAIKSLVRCIDAVRDLDGKVPLAS